MTNSAGYEKITHQNMLQEWVRPGYLLCFSVNVSSSHGHCGGALSTSLSYFGWLCEMCVGTWASSGPLALTGREAHRHLLSVTLQSILQSTAQWSPRVTTGFQGGNIPHFVRSNSNMSSIWTLYLCYLHCKNIWTHRCWVSKHRYSRKTDEKLKAGYCRKVCCVCQTCLSCGFLISQVYWRMTKPPRAK